MLYHWILKLQFAVFCYQNLCADFAEATSRSAVTNTIIASWNTQTSVTQRLRSLVWNTNETQYDSGTVASRRRSQGT